MGKKKEPKSLTKSLAMKAHRLQWDILVECPDIPKSFASQLAVDKLGMGHLLKGFPKKPINSCFPCEEAWGNCSECLLEWPEGNCTSSESPYTLWDESRFEEDLQQTIKFAKQTRDLPRRR